MRGEYTKPKNIRARRAGSSPHAWGIPSCYSVVSSTRRFIPTCVGNTKPTARSFQNWPVHPHMRGEYAKGHRKIKFARRFIPTCVGNTGVSYCCFRALTVHPHMRGEYKTAQRAGVYARGSSPHAWGIPAVASGLGRCQRFIPTCVGNTTWPTCSP